MAHDDQRIQYAALQYETVRQESNQARQDMHSILAWNQALIVALFGTGLVIIGSGKYLDIAELTFGFVVPLLLIGGVLAWAGEMIRMERTAVYLRALERSVWSRSADGSEVNTSWFIWENFLWAPPKEIAHAGFRKQSTGYAGVAMFFATVYVGSAVVLVVIAPWWLSVADILVVVVIGVAVVLPPLHQIFALGGLAPSISDGELSEWVRTLPDRKRVGEQVSALGFVQRALARPPRHGRLPAQAGSAEDQRGPMPTRKGRKQTGHGRRV